METPGRPTSQQNHSIDDEDRADALDILGDVLVWRLAPSRWDQVLAVIGTLAAAVSAGDPAAFRQAGADLELLAPPRITRIGGTSKVPPPEDVRDRTNQLIHTLETGASKTGRPADEDERGGKDDRPAAR